MAKFLSLSFYLAGIIALISSVKNHYAGNIELMFNHGAWFFGLFVIGAFFSSFVSIND